MSLDRTTAGDPNPVSLDLLATEAARPELSELDMWSTSDALGVFFDDQVSVVEALRAAHDQVVAAVELIADRLCAGGRLIYVGAGTGGRLAALDAAEIAPSYGVQGVIVAVFAGGVDAMADGREFYEDDEKQGAAQVLALAPTARDVVVGVSASGRTPYVLGGVSAARDAGAHTVGFACVVGSPLVALAHTPIEVDTGPEVIAGSTRLKAGSAQKTVLNAMSTMAMVRMGRTHGNLMVDLSADNAKLRRRALRAVADATGVDHDRAAAALDAAGGQAKVAIVSLLAGVRVDAARRLLARTDGRVRLAVALAATPD
jgi:N-acetylmuramic acid 6-phosphate etherase